MSLKIIVLRQPLCSFQGDETQSITLKKFLELDLSRLVIAVNEFIK